MDTFLFCDFLNFGSGLPSVAIRNYIPTDEIFEIIAIYRLLYALYLKKNYQSLKLETNTKSSANFSCIPSIVLDRLLQRSAHELL